MTKNIAALIDENDLAPEKRIASDLKEVHRILEKYAGARGELIAILEEVQAIYGYLPEQALRTVAEQTGTPLVDVYGVATFYSSFSLKPRGKHVVCACMGTACHVRGATRVVESLERQLGITSGETTPDKEFTLETVNCLGACALGPVVVIDGHYFSKVRKTGVRELIDNTRNGFGNTLVEGDKRVFPVEVSCPHCSHSLMDSNATLDGHPAISLIAANRHKHAKLLISSLYGSPGMMIERDLDLKSEITLVCPHCHDRLTGAWECPECEAPMASMIVKGGGVLRICSRPECRGHLLDMV